MTQETIDNLIQELRRGVIVLAVLSLLAEEHYGYEVLKLLSDQGMEIDQGTLYPLLRRLENQGLLESHWRLEAARQRKYYIISLAGREVFPRLRDEWQKMTDILNRLLSQFK
ncbi:MAG: PadR family transcriptional regulator [Anaerolineales bacterium]|nr:PadR family transcriptional regulator [Anaerolineales bacterium]